MDEQMVKAVVKNVVREALAKNAAGWMKSGKVSYREVPDSGMGLYYVKIGDEKEMMITKDDLMWVLKKFGK